MLKKLAWLALWPCVAVMAEENLPDALTDEEVDSSPIFVEPKSPEPITARAGKSQGLIQQRVESEKAVLENPFVITPHKPNYFLPIKYQDGTEASDASAFSGELDDLEFKFQLSVKFPIAYNLFGSKASLWGAYTQQALWQSYNTKISSPFRETNYEPEVFVLFDFERQISSSLKTKYVSLGFNHQSNGRMEPLSRSWNRLYAEFFFESENAVVSLKPWYRIPESDNEDDNPNIEKYLGYGELNAVYVVDDYSFDLMLRNNLRTDNKGAIQIGFTFPMWGKTRGYIQYFDGYGQTLAEYDDNVRSIGMGVMLTNWL